VFARFVTRRARLLSAPEDLLEIVSSRGKDAQSVCFLARPARSAELYLMLIGG
jgi:hypothetical protein